MRKYSQMTNIKSDGWFLRNPFATNLFQDSFLLPCSLIGVYLYLLDTDICDQLKLKLPENLYIFLIPVIVLLQATSVVFFLRFCFVCASISVPFCCDTTFRSVQALPGQQASYSRKRRFLLPCCSVRFCYSYCSVQVTYDGMF